MSRLTHEEFTIWVASSIDRLLAAGISPGALAEMLEWEIAAGQVEPVSGIDRQTAEIAQRVTEAHESQFVASRSRRPTTERSPENER